MFHLLPRIHLRSVPGPTNHEETHYPPSLPDRFGPASKHRTHHRHSTQHISLQPGRSGKNRPIKPGSQKERSGQGYGLHRQEIFPGHSEYQPHLNTPTISREGEFSTGQVLKDHFRCFDIQDIKYFYYLFYVFSTSSFIGQPEPFNSHQMI